MHGTFDVRYPSGRRFTVDGDLHLMVIGDCGISPVILQDPDQALVLDPRAIIRCAGAVVYRPDPNHPDASQLVKDHARRN